MDSVYCEDCRRLTSGNCGAHGPTIWSPSAAGAVDLAVDDPAVVKAKQILSGAPTPRPATRAEAEAAASQVLVIWSRTVGATLPDGPTRQSLVTAIAAFAARVAAEARAGALGEAAGLLERSAAFWRRPEVRKVNAAAVIRAEECETQAANIRSLADQPPPPRAGVEAVAVIEAAVTFERARSAVPSIETPDFQASLEAARVADQAFQVAVREYLAATRAASAAGAPGAGGGT
jgi:hypothetical protein